VLAAARSGIWLVVRTATLQGAVTLTTLVAATAGTVGLAAHQVVNSLWVLLAFALDVLGHQVGDSRLIGGRPLSAVCRRRVL
jgi:Na+-driven multidrug efflux pump